jgi:hypothetical protein
MTPKAMSLNPSIRPNRIVWLPAEHAIHTTPNIHAVVTVRRLRRRFAPRTRNAGTSSYVFFSQAMVFEPSGPTTTPQTHAISAAAGPDKRFPVILPVCF